MKHIGSFIIVCLLLICTSNAQNVVGSNKIATKAKAKIVKVKQFPVEGNLVLKFDYITEKSGKYQIYKVIKIDWLKKMRQSIVDTMKMNKKNKHVLLSQIDKQLININGLKTELSDTKIKLIDSNSRKDNFHLFGFNINKKVIWLINGFFLLCAIIFFLLFKRSNCVTSETKDSLKHINDEFEAHRKRSLEKEQVLARKLHDALHK